MAEEQAQPQLALERIYVKDMSLEVPGASVFTKEWNPELDINLSSNAEKLDDDHYQIVLTVSVTAKMLKKRHLSLKYIKQVSSC